MGKRFVSPFFVGFISLSYAFAFYFFKQTVKVNHFSVRLTFLHSTSPMKISAVRKFQMSQISESDFLNWIIKPSPLFHLLNTYWNSAFWAQWIFFSETRADPWPKLQFLSKTRPVPISKLEFLSKTRADLWPKLQFWSQTRTVPTGKLEFLSKTRTDLWPKLQFWSQTRNFWHRDGRRGGKQEFRIVRHNSLTSSSSQLSG